MLGLEGVSLPQTHRSYSLPGRPHQETPQGSEEQASRPPVDSDFLRLGFLHFQVLKELQRPHALTQSRKFNKGGEEAAPNRKGRSAQVNIGASWQDLQAMASLQSGSWFEAVFCHCGG